MWVALPPDPDGEPVWEGLLAPLTPQPDLAVIAAVPVFAYDLNLGDEVEVVASAEGPLVAVRPVHDAGRFTFRVLFPDAVDPDDRSWLTLQRDLEPFGCWFDVYSTPIGGGLGRARRRPGGRRSPGRRAGRRAGGSTRPAGRCCRAPRARGVHGTVRGGHHDADEGTADARTGTRSRW